VLLCGTSIDPNYYVTNEAWLKTRANNLRTNKTKQRNKREQNEKKRNEQQLLFRRLAMRIENCFNHHTITQNGKTIDVF
jgi:ribonuclease PH